MASSFPTRLLIEDLPGLRRLALVEVGSGDLLDFAVEKASRARDGEVGDLFAGRVTALRRDLEAAFIDISGDVSAFLPLSEAPEGLSEGDLLTLRIVRSAKGQKGPKVTAALSKAECARLPEGWQNRKCGLLLPAGDALRALLDRGPEEVIVEGLGLFQSLKEQLSNEKLSFSGELHAHTGRVPLFHDEDLEEELEGLLHSEVDLPSGGALIIEPGETLTAVDVDRRRHRAAKSGEAYSLNLEAVVEFARQMRLRNLSGRMVVDLLRMDKTGERKAVEKALADALRDDPQPVRLQPISRSGLLELTRRRARAPLHELLMRPVGLLGRGWELRPETEAFAALRALASAQGTRPGTSFGLAVSPEVSHALLEGEVAPAHAYLESRLGRKIHVRERLGGLAFELEES